MNAFFSSLVGHKIRSAIILIIILGGGYFTYKHFSASDAPVRYVLAQASKQTIITSVSGTGQVSQDRTVNLTPATSGKLVSVSVKQGAKVKAGQVIATVDQTNNSISLNQARASLASAQASYDQVLAGSTSQDIQLSELTVQSDQQAVTNASSSLETVKQKDATAVSNALSNLLNANLTAVPTTGNAGNATITISGNYIGTGQGSYKIAVYSTGAGYKFSTAGLESSTGSVRSSPPEALGTNGLQITFSGTPNNSDSWTVAIPNTSGTSYLSNYNAYQTALANQASDLVTSQSQITSAQNKLLQDQISLQQKQAPPTDQALESAKAQLISAQAQLQNAQINFNNNVLKAPFDGVVAQINNQPGDQVTASTNVATVITNQSLAVITLNEVDVSKIKQDDKATMSFDAIDGLTITGKVVQIDNIGTVSQGVVNYNVKIAFDTEDSRVRPGMSVNVSIITNIAADVLTVPSGAIQAQGKGNYVLKVDPAQTQTVAGQTGVTTTVPPSHVTVETGVSDDSNTEVSNGLSEGDTIVIQTINPTTTKSTASSATSALRLGGGAGAGGFGGAAGTTRAGGAATGRATTGR